MKKIILIFTFMLLWAGWFFFYPCHLRWLEGFSFFSTMPDFAGLCLDLPGDIFKYAGAFLLQFYSVPAVGAAIQASFPLLVILCVYAMVCRLFDDHEGLMWIAYLPLPVCVLYQMDDMTLDRSVMIVSFTLAAVLVLSVATLKRSPSRSLPRIFRNRYLALAVIMVTLCSSFVILTGNDRLNSKHEDRARLEYFGENQKWDKILESVSVQDAARFPYKLKWVLLALSESGILPDYAFRYGLSSSEDFVYAEPMDPFEYTFNTVFYRSLGLNNSVIHNAYEQALKSLPGLTFDSVRTLADTYLELKDHDMAKKYMDALSHTAFHGKWVRERLPLLEDIKGQEPEYRQTGEKFMMDFFLADIASLVERYKDDHKFADYLMCGLLADMDGNKFFQVFNSLYPLLYQNIRPIPRLYQEALVIIGAKEPRVLEVYNIDYEVLAGYKDFADLVRSGRAAQAKRKYAGSYWAYIY